MIRFLAALLLAFSAHAEPPALTWSPTDHSQFVAVSGASATRTQIPFGGAWMTARSDTPQSSGVRDAEIAIGEIGSGIMVGIANGAATTNGSLGDTSSIAYWSIGNTLKNSTWGGVMPPAFTTGDVVGIEANLDLHTVRFRKNGGAWSATLDTSALGPDLYIAVSLGQNAPATSVTVVSDTWNDYPYPTINALFHGDSITIGAVRQAFPQLLGEHIKSSRVGWANVYKTGINGVTWQYAWSAAGYPYSLIQDGARIDAQRLPNVENWLIAFAGTNGFAIFHDTAARQCADMDTYIAQRIAAGWQADHIIIPTMLPRDGVETDRQLYIACQQTVCASRGCRIARLDLDPNIGAPGANANPTYYQDRIHPTQAGHPIIESIIYGVMFP